MSTAKGRRLRMFPVTCHPQNGAPVFGQDAVVQGAKTLFSKVASKKWPRAADICSRLQEFSRIPVAIQLLCNEQPQGVSKDSSLPLEVKGAINSKARARTVDPDALLPLDHVTFHAIHSTGKEILFSTDADGRSQDVLHPGKFLLRCDQKGNYDRLEPGMIEVPAAFEPLQFTIMAKMKKRCTFQVVDHLNRPYPRFPMRIVPKEGLNEGITLATKAKSRLGVGVHVASYISEEEPSSWPVDVLSQELEVQDIDAHQLFRIIVKRLRFACEFVLRSRFDEPVRRCPFVVRSKLDGSYIASGTTSDAGVANVELPVGTMQFHLAPKHTSAFVATSFEVQVNDNGDFLPLRQEVETKSVNVQLNLITPDGEPAPFCNFQLKARFSQDGSLSTENALSLCLEPGIFGAELTAMPVPGPQGIAFVNALARSPSPNFRDRIPASFSFSEAPRPREVPCGRSAVDPRAKRPVACAAWAHNFPIQGGKRMIGKMDSVEEETGTESALGTPALTHRVPQPRVVPTIPATNRPTYGLDGQANSGSVPQQELPASPASPNHSPLSPTRIVRSKPIEVKPVEATVATAEERLSSNPQDGHMSLESALQEIQKLRQQNQQLLKEAESQCQPKNDDSDLVAKNAQLERDARDMLQQFEEFEREKEDEVKEFQEEIAQLNAKLAEKDVAMKRYKSEVERERENLLQAMTDESSELQGSLQNGK
eukprot:symbB.v1.2.024659.t1/scaffold2352.1/size103767/5